MNSNSVDLLNSIHVFCRNGQWLGFHRDSNRILELSAEDADIIQQLIQSPEDEHPKGKALIDELGTILGNSKPIVRSLEPINTFYLRLNRNCNLQCDYCHAISRTRKKRDNRVLSPELASMAASVMGRLGAKGVGLHGGDPFFDWSNTYAVLKAIRDAVPEMNIGITCNGTMVTEEITCALKQLGVLTSVEIDGCQRVHDQFKRYPNGDSSYLDAIEGAKRLRDNGLLAAIESTVSGKDGYDAEGYRNLNTLFPGIPVIVARIKDRRPRPWLCSENELRRFLNEQIDCILQSVGTLNDTVAGLVNLSSTPVVSEYRCICFLDKVSVDLDGAVYICPKEESERTFIGRITDIDFQETFWEKRRYTAQLFSDNQKAPVWYSHLVEYCIDSTKINELGQERLQNEGVLEEFFEDVIYCCSQIDTSLFLNRWANSGF